MAVARHSRRILLQPDQKRLRLVELLRLTVSLGQRIGQRHVELIGRVEFLEPFDELFFLAQILQDLFEKKIG